MSRRAPSTYLSSPTGVIVGMVGLDGREYLFPTPLAAPPNVGTPASVWAIYDSDGRPIGLSSPDGDRFFAEPLTLAPPTGARRIAVGVQELVTETSVLGLMGAIQGSFSPPLTGDTSPPPTEMSITLVNQTPSAPAWNLPTLGELEITNAPPDLVIEIVQPGFVVVVGA